MFETQITILGLGERVQGTNANGAYDIVQMAFSYPDKRMEGVNAASIIVNGDTVERVLVGDTVRAMLIFQKVEQKNGKYKSVLSRVVLL